MVQAQDVWKIHRSGVESVEAVRGVDLTIRAGELVALAGPSGSGKSTLLYLLGAMDSPTRGRVSIGGHALPGMSAAERTRFRRDRIGFVFQSFNLLPALTALENVALPARLAGKPRLERLERARQLLARVGLERRSGHYPPQLSGGERQRVAIARALINNPVLILADEPTGNLDTATSRSILALLRELHAAGQTMLIVTHNEEVAAWAERVLQMRDGRLITA